ncbi:M1 family metallopeptidase [Candidatus Nomurabacteria bacterium]|nr:M1 family metallopeptidase [Candidatus Nomurabacteria bacterium]
MNKKPTTKTNKNSVLLPSHIIPKSYTLEIKSDLEAFTFAGHEIISIIVDKPTKEITLHSKDINIETVKIIQGKAMQFAVKIAYDTKKETATFIFKDIIKKGKAELSIVFDGIINETLRGFYRSKYTIDAETKHIATTQFEATDARRAFPCFDEPAQKAIFNVTLIVPGTHTAISNTLPESIAEHEAGYKIIKFAPTPIMSTYLLAFIIGEFEWIEGRTKDNVQVRVFTTKGKKHQAKFSLDVAIRSIEFYNDYFNIPYPLPVLDLIAIPDFESAAMENWGAITFRESALLVDIKNSSLSNKQWVAIVIAHEIAHQWFGNLVTMQWWTDLWLNEGFASYMENVCVDHMFPEWHVWDLYLADRYAVALRLDALANSHPIEVTVHHPDEINEIFDMVSYAKGSAVIRQLADYLGFEKFREGLRYYLKKHSYKNTETTDLWFAFEKASGKPVRKIMESWTKKTGYPLVTLVKSKKGYTAKQERFFSSRISAKENKNSQNTIWQIPFKYESNNEILKVLATTKSVPLIGTSIGKVNHGEGSFMRTRYDADTLARLKEEIHNGKLGVHDRLGIIRDLFALAEGGYIPTTEALEFSLAYKNEKEYIVWSELASGIARVANIISNESFLSLYKSYMHSLFGPLSERMGFDKKKGEDHADTFLRSLALSNASYSDDPIVIKKAKALFIDRERHEIPADIRGTVYSIVAMHGGAKEWELFKKLYIAEQLQEQKDRYGRALVSFRDKTLLAKTLMFAISKDVRTQDAPFLLGAVWQNTYGRTLSWLFMKHNWKIMLSRYGEGGHFLSRIISALGSHTQVKDAIDAKKFFVKNNAPGSDRTLQQAYEKIYSNALWLKEDKVKIKKWLEKNYKK